MRRSGRNRRAEETRRGTVDDLDSRLNALNESAPKRRRKKRSNAGPTIIGLLLIFCVLGAIYLIYTTATGGDEVSEGPVKVTVVKGDSLSSVAEKLQDAGAIDSATMFKLEARVGGHSTEIKPGEYTIRPDEDTGQILQKLTAGEDASTFTVTIPEGMTLQQTAQTVAEETDISAKDFEAAAKQTNYGYAFLKAPAIKSTEGFLFPKQYEFEAGTKPREMVSRFLEQYLVETQGLDIAGAKERLNLTEYELVTVASLVEREAANAEERPIIASVIYNRIRQGMPLQIDATIQYARGKPKEELSLQDLEIDSPYNTYKNPGLPPGPIASPGLESLKAAIDPAETDYLYYVLDADNEEHYFTDDYDDFLRAKEEAGR